MPTGPGEPKQLDGHGIIHNAATWFPDGTRVLLAGTEANHGARLYVQDITTNKVTAISPEGTNALTFALSPDGQQVAAVGPDGKGYFFPVATGEPKPIVGLLGEKFPWRGAPTAVR